MVTSLVFKQTMDHHAVTAVRIEPGGPECRGKERELASLQWHPDRPPRLVSYSNDITLEELVAITAKLKELASPKIEGGARTTQAFIEGAVMGAKPDVPLRDMECIAADCVVRALVLVRLIPDAGLDRLSQYMRAAASASEIPAEGDIYHGFVIAIEREQDERKRQKAKVSK